LSGVGTSSERSLWEPDSVLLGPHLLVPCDHAGRGVCDRRPSPAAGRYGRHLRRAAAEAGGAQPGSTPLDGYLARSALPTGASGCDPGLRDLFRPRWPDRPNPDFGGWHPVLEPARRWSQAGRDAGGVRQRMPATEVSMPRHPSLARSSTAQTSDRHVCSPGRRPITLTRRRLSPKVRSSKFV